MKSIIVPLNEPARRNLMAKDEISTTDSSAPTNHATEAQLERSRKKLHRYVQRRQLALAQHQLENMSLNDSTNATKDLAKTRDSIRHPTPASPNNAAKLVIEQQKMVVRMESLAIDERPVMIAKNVQRRKRERLKIALDRRQMEEGSMEDSGSTSAPMERMDKSNNAGSPDGGQVMGGTFAGLMEGDQPMS